MSLLKKLFRGKPQELPPLKLWGIIEGPFHRDEVEGAYDEDLEWMLLMKVSIGDEVKDSEVWFETYEEVYKIKKYFDKNIEPMEVKR